MARSYGKTYLSIWGDGDFRALHPDAQRMYLFLTSQQDLSCVGTIPLRISRWANCAADQTAQRTSGPRRRSWNILIKIGGVGGLVRHEVQC